MSGPDKLVAVAVPPSTIDLLPAAKEVWDATGAFLELAFQSVGDEMAYSVVLSRVMREMRRQVGAEGTKQCLEGYIATMDQAAAGDL